MKDLSHIKNILFDLGGVLYELDFAQLEKNFSLLHKKGEAIPYSKHAQHEIFSLYETGKATSTEFRDVLRQEFQLEGTDAAIDSAWNSLLVQMYPNRVELLKGLKSKFRIALLSNTNEIHIRHVADECSELFNQFERLFLSYEIGLRKPNADIFEFALNEMNFLPSETLFIDDSPQHIECAKSVGLQTFWVKNEQDLYELFFDN